MICRHLIFKNGCCFTWFFPLTLQNRTLSRESFCELYQNPRALPIECVYHVHQSIGAQKCELITEIRVSAELTTEIQLGGQGRRSVREDPLVGPLHSAGWPSPGAFSPLRCATIETSLIVVLTDFMSSDRPSLIGRFENADQNR